MVVMKTIIDSFSRCLGSQHQEVAASARNPDIRSLSRPGSPSAAALPLGASRERLSYDRNESQSEQEQVQGNEFAANRRACCDLPPSYPSDSLDTDREHANILAHARKKATVSSRRHHRSSSTSSTSHRSSLEKARLKTTKRKLGIFRKSPEKPSSLTSFLGSNSGIPRMLCFANPILDSIDDDAGPMLHRGNDFTMDEETIASTLYFDAKYDHIPQDQEPIPLLPEFIVPHSDSNDDIIQIYNTGSHKTIHSIYCGLPPSPPNNNTNMMDDRSSSSESTEDVISFSEEQFLEEHVDTKYHASCMPMPTPPICKGKNELDIIQELLKQELSKVELPPGLRLMSNSSNSTNAVTAVCSSKSTLSLSPKNKYGQMGINNGVSTAGIEK
mmetsp:Transcript_5885/g.8886  ORF Transcript_5885/g.8886 Transcript_5885/m.8886 type:complete len:386 (-) Transcript_5885:47-1204(-)